MGRWYAVLEALCSYDAAIFFLFSILPLLLMAFALHQQRYEIRDALCVVKECSRYLGATATALLRTGWRKLFRKPIYCFPPGCAVKRARNKYEIPGVISFERYGGRWYFQTVGRSFFRDNIDMAVFSLGMPFELALLEQFITGRCTALEFLRYGGTQDAGAVVLDVEMPMSKRLQFATQVAALKDAGKGRLLAVVMRLGGRIAFFDL